MKVKEFELETEKTFYDYETEKIEKIGISKISNDLYCITGENIFDNNQHTILIETDNPVKIMQLLYERTLNKSSHDIIFMPEVNFMFDHGYYAINYKKHKLNERLYLVRLYCRPIDYLNIYEKGE